MYTPHPSPFIHQPPHNNNIKHRTQAYLARRLRKTHSTLLLHHHHHHKDEDGSTNTNTNTRAGREPSAPPALAPHVTYMGYPDSVSVRRLGGWLWAVGYGDGLCVSVPLLHIETTAIHLITPSPPPLLTPNQIN